MTRSAVKTRIDLRVRWINSSDRTLTPALLTLLRRIEPPRSGRDIFRPPKLSTTGPRRRTLSTMLVRPGSRQRQPHCDVAAYCRRLGRERATNDRRPASVAALDLSTVVSLGDTSIFLSSSSSSVRGFRPGRLNAPFLACIRVAVRDCARCLRSRWRERRSAQLARASRIRLLRERDGQDRRGVAEPRLGGLGRRSGDQDLASQSQVPGGSSDYGALADLVSEEQAGEQPALGHLRRSLVLREDWMADIATILHDAPEADGKTTARRETAVDRRTTASRGSRGNPQRCAAEDYDAGIPRQGIRGAERRNLRC